MKSTLTHDRNKEKDFQALEKASDTLQEKLRLDESSFDLYDQFQYRTDIPGSHKYFVEPYKQSFGSLIEHSNFIALPSRILEEYNKIECASFMGIIPEINRVWITVDNKLYLWNYFLPEEFDLYDGLSEVIVSVALATPKVGVFMDTVKYVLVVATPVEVVVIAVTCDSNCRLVRLIPTAYKLPTDNVTMFKMIGSQGGRIFMAGNDGNLYELDYSNTENSWASLAGISGSNFKCQKINHFAWNWKLTHLLPPFLRLSLTNVDDILIDIVVDDVRKVLYAITSHGSLSAFYLGREGIESQYIVRSFNVLDEAKAVLSNRRDNPDTLLKPDSFKDSNSFDNSPKPGFNIISLHIIPVTESKKAHLMVILANGIRIYLSLGTSSFGGGYSKVFHKLPSKASNEGNPSSIMVSHIRSPPKLTTIQGSYLGSFAADESHDTGSLPAYIATQPLHVNSSFYSHGVLLMSIDKASESDQLVGIFEDVISRGNLQYNPWASQMPSLKEGVTVPLDSRMTNGKIYDMKETSTHIHLPDIIQMRSLFYFSSTPTTVKDHSHLYYPSHDENNNSNNKAHSLHPITFSPSLNPAKSNSLKSFGYDPDNLDHICQLNELAYQHIPISSISTQRHFLVLTNNGIHILKKVRPSDVLYRQISQFNRDNSFFQHFFNSYGSVQASAMCIALACGLPADAGGTESTDPSVLTSMVPIDTIQKVSINIMRALTESATYKVIGSGNLTALTVKDSRVVLNGSTHEFIRSPIHEALYMVVSRILRPIWLRDVVVNGELSDIWTAALMNQIRVPLFHIQKLLKSYFASAILSDPNKVDFITNLNQNPSEHLITSQMHIQAQIHENPEKTLLHQARSLEDASINSLYRLISRVLHGLSLIEILSQMQIQWKITIKWMNLSLTSFRALVISSKLHEKVKLLISDLIKHMNDSSIVEKSQISDQIIEWMTSNCYHYFSIGDLYTFQVSRLIKDLNFALTSNHSSNRGIVFEKEHESTIREIIRLVILSSKYWNALEDVKDILNGEPSILSGTCDILMKYGSLGRDGIVELCFATANNFIRKHDSRGAGVISTISSELSIHSGFSEESWDRGLYHGGSILNESDSTIAIKACYGCIIKHIFLIGADIPQLGEGSVGLVDMQNPTAAAERNMSAIITKATKSTTDPLFHELLYDRLLVDNRQQLITIHSGFVEEFLREKDSLLLYSYYEVHCEYLKAANLMSLLAKTDKDLDISIRIDFLTKAVSSAEKASSMNMSLLGTNANNNILFITNANNNNNSMENNGIMNNNNLDISKKMVSDVVLDLKDTLEIAEYQQRAYDMVSNDFESLQGTLHTLNELQQRNFKQMQETVHKLKYTLLSITILYNDVSVPYKLWEVCLMLLHASKTSNPDMVKRLWKSIIYRLVPDVAENESCVEFLKIKRESGEIDVDKRHQCGGVVIFEAAGQWLPLLENTVVELGISFQAAMVGSNSSFPHITILEELEEIVSSLMIAHANNSIIPKGWAAQCFRDIGFSHSTIVEAYMDIFDTWKGKAPAKLLCLITSATHVLLSWTKTTRDNNSNGPDANESRLLLQSIRSNRFRKWLEKLRQLVSNLNNGRGLSKHSMDLLTYVNTDINEVDRRVKVLTMM
eukprot:gene7824-10628_t